MTSRSRPRSFLPIAVALALLALPAYAAEVTAQRPHPGGKPGVANKPLKVFILAGQSEALLEMERNRS